MQFAFYLLVSVSVSWEFVLLELAVVATSELTLFNKSLFLRLQPHDQARTSPAFSKWKLCLLLVVMQLASSATTTSSEFFCIAFCVTRGSRRIAAVCPRPWLIYSEQLSRTPKAISQPLVIYAADNDRDCSSNIQN